MRVFVGISAFFILLVGLPLTASAVGQEALPFRRAIELALSHSSEMAVSQADEARAYRTYLEARNSYIPQAAIGSDVGYAYGFPLSLEGSAPTLFNVTAQSSVFNRAHREFIRAAKAEWGVGRNERKERRAEVSARTGPTPIQLNRGW